MMRNLVISPSGLMSACHLVIVFIAFVSVTSSGPVLYDAAYHPKPGCLIDDEFYKVGDNFTDQDCTQQCQCMGGGGLYMPVCWPLCHMYPSDCPEEELIRVRMIPVGPPGSKCKCKEAVCKEGPGHIEY